MTFDDVPDTTHQPIGNSIAAAVAPAAPFRWIVGPRNIRGRDLLLAVDRKRRGSADKRKPEMLCDHAAAGFHLVGDDRVRTDRSKRRGGLAADHVGEARDLRDHPAKAERTPEAAHCPDAQLERHARVARPADRLEADLRPLNQGCCVGLVDEGCTMPPRDQLGSEGC